jgi:hypothetical protein
MMFPITSFDRIGFADEIELVLVMMIFFFSLNHCLIFLPMASELPGTPDTEVLAVIAAVADVQAVRGEAPNYQLPMSIILLLTSGIGIRHAVP